MEPINDFNPWCIFACTFKSALWSKAMLHLERVNGFSCLDPFIPLWIRSILECLVTLLAWKWFLLSEGPVMPFEQLLMLFYTWNMQMTSILSCMFKSAFWSKVIPHCGQENGFFKYHSFIRKHWFLDISQLKQQYYSVPNY